VPVSVRRTADHVVDLVRSDGPPVVIMTGRTGVGRTSVLFEVGQTLRDDGREVVDIRVARDRVFLGEPGGTTAQHEQDILQVWPADGAHADPAIAHRAAAAVAASLVARQAVVLIDDGQWMDRDAAAVLEALAHRLATTTVRCVCAVALPCPEPLATSGAAALRRLRAQGLVDVVRVPTLDEEATTRAVRALVGAAPSPELVTHVRARSRGVAAAVVEVVSSLRRVDGVRLVSGHAYLVPDPPDEPAPDREPALLQNLRQLGPHAWQTGCTAAALEQAGPALPALLATATEMPMHEVFAHLHDLQAAGVLHHSRDGSWRFLVPVLRDHLRAELGPYQRRMLAALLVRAAWRGEIQLARPDLADHVAAAGRLLPADRAHDELVTAAEQARSGPVRRRHARWWRAAAELATHREDRLRARLEHARASERAGDAPATIAAARALLDDGSALSEDVRHELSYMLVLSLHRNGETDELDRVADGIAPWTGDEAMRTLCRVLAHALRGRWGVADSLLAPSRPIWAARPATRALGDSMKWIADVFSGRLGPDDGLGGDGSPSGGPPWRRRVVADWEIACRLSLGDVKGSWEWARQAGIAASDLFPPHRAALALHEGTPEAPELARRAIAFHDSPEFGPTRGTFYQLYASLSLIKGQLTTARRLTATARTESPALEHVLDFSDATIELVLGDVDAARARLETAFIRARDNHLLVGTDLLLSLLIEIKRNGGDTAGARARARELDQVATALHSPRATVHAAFGRAIAHTDDTAAADCLRLARENGLAHEGAHLALRLALAGLVDPAVLLDVYAFYGRLDALLARAWTRMAMEARGVPVKGRAITKSENERLLGQLLTEGLTNRQIATLLYTSEKSVEGRLGRLLARTGYRSRIELTAALLDGSYVL
jgi:DNA-binding CsgD family transcriptional regulator